MAAMPLWRTEGVGRWHLDTHQHLLLPPQPRCRISQIDLYGGTYVNGMVLHYEAADEKNRYATWSETSSSELALHYTYGLYVCMLLCAQLAVSA